ncbi:MAG: translation elongation factor Ts [Pseudomonadota bacterium]|nr:translation elongation factor Ts [Gammaproteobacteria bacterium]MBU1558636.1 translation elongation factor Ts [Gammaproteobacteria bacterium]MBU1926676.1 translation elongation factor Ts [Gammaproteobacteria bacterium]MBU2546519.1 translation elongation factor Ts [Gammaproteobacteria bacterium]
MAITASQVSELRRLTSCGMMDCKKALQEAEGDLEKAADLLRKKGMMKAAKKADRIAAEGVVVVREDQAGKSVVILEINSETDFVARDQNFLRFTEALSGLAMTQQIASLEQLMASPLSDGKTADQVRQELIIKLGENINVRRLQAIKSDHVLGVYVHGHRIGVVVELEGGDANLAKDLAMHIAASKPSVITSEQIPEEVVAKEKEIFTEQAKASGAKEEIIEKMVNGKLKKYFDEVCLLRQPFVKSPDLTVAKLLEQSKAKVLSFIRFELGEGIEKETTNFAEEVQAQVQGK